MQANQRQSVQEGKMARTDVQVRNNVLSDPFGEVLCPFRAADETILCPILSISTTACYPSNSRRTSSASQLAMTTFLRGFQPFLSKAPKPRTISCRDTVPDTGSTAPMTHAEKYYEVKVTTR